MEFWVLTIIAWGIFLVVAYGFYLLSKIKKENREKWQNYTMNIVGGAIGGMILFLSFELKKISTFVKLLDWSLALLLLLAMTMVFGYFIIEDNKKPRKRKKIVKEIFLLLFEIPKHFTKVKRKKTSEIKAPITKFVIGIILFTLLIGIDNAKKTAQFPWLPIFLITGIISFWFLSDFILYSISIFSNKKIKQLRGKYFFGIGIAVLSSGFIIMFTIPESALAIIVTGIIMIIIGGVIESK